MYAIYQEALIILKGSIRQYISLLLRLGLVTQFEAKVKVKPSTLRP
jgi:hypothetical protein